MGQIKATGWLPIGRGSVSLKDVYVDDSSRIGYVESAFRTVMIEFDWTRPILGLTATATAQACLNESIEYVKV